MTRESNPLRTAFVVVVALLGLLHMAAVTLAALPDNRYSEAAEPATSYLGSYFNQNWRLFAPAPVSSDRGVLVQGAYRDASGSVRTTPFVDWTDVELDLVRHRLIGNRGGYTTAKMYGSLKRRLNELDDRQESVVTSDDLDDVPTWEHLRRRLIGPDTGSIDADVVSFLRYERAMTRLATAVVEARWPEREIVAVRFATRSQAVTPYEKRHGTAAEREKARPPVATSVRGWREPLRGSAAERRAIADFDRRHR